MSTSGARLPFSVTRRRYHHGDLRAALLRAAVELIEQQGIHKLSLRACARRTGVSHAAPYRHFADKEALLFAIVRDGFEMLHRRGQEAIAGVADARDRLDAHGVAYVRFAIEHPVHVRMMFTMPIPASDAGVSVGEEAFDLLVELASAVAGPDVEPREAATAAWSISHGLSMLMLDGRIPEVPLHDPAAVEILVRRVFALWRGPFRGGAD